MDPPVPLLDLARVLAPHREALRAAFDRCLDHGGFVLGQEVTAFEAQLAAYTGVRHAVGLSSGTDALLASFLALEPAPAPGDEFITTAFTFISSATSLLRAGLRPVFCDLQPGQFYPGLAQIEAAIGPRTRGLLLVHLFGEAQPVEGIAELCAQRGLLLVEDCAQAIGARTPDGGQVGRAGLCSTLSFFPAKSLGALGDGGATLTDDADFAGRLRAVRQHGCTVRYRHERLGGNFRLDALQAALLGVLLPHLDTWLAARRRHADRYAAAFAHLGDRLALPPHTPGHAWNQYVVRTPQRDRLRAALDQAGIGSAIYYPAPLHHQPALAAARPPANLPEAERACREVLALPVYPGLTADEQERVVAVVNAALS